MKHRLLIVVCLALLVLAASASFAITQVDDVKYEQPPKFDGGFSLASDMGSGFTMYDDFVCWDGRDVIDIHWWGSYWMKQPGAYPFKYSDTLPGAQSGGIDSFTISFYNPIAAGVDPYHPFAHPGNPIASYTIAGNCNETKVATVDKKDPSGNVVCSEDVYNYSVNLRDLGLPAFQQVKGQTYWISIVAGFAAEDRQWGWREMDGHVGALGVQSQGTEVKSFDNPCGGHDMAFRLTSDVPEPGSLLALGSGLTGLLGFALRRRNK